MKVVALVSGGKDSCFAMMKSIQYGHEVLSSLLIPHVYSSSSSSSFVWFREHC